MKDLIWLETENFPITLIQTRKNVVAKLWFTHSCNHKFKLSPAAITHSQQDSLCPFCCDNSSLLCGEIDCTHCFDRSLANFVFKGLIWHPTKNANVRLHTIFPGSHNKYHFKSQLFRSVALEWSFCHRKQWLFRYSANYWVYDIICIHL